MNRRSRAKPRIFRGERAARRLLFVRSMTLRIEKVDAGTRVKVTAGERDVDDVETRFAIPRPSNRPPPSPTARVNVPRPPPLPRFR